MLDQRAAIRSLRDLFKEIDDLEDSHLNSAKHIKWKSNTLYLLEDIFGRNSRIFMTFATLTWQPSGSFIASRFDAEMQLHNRKLIAYHEHLDISRGLLSSGIDQIERKRPHQCI